MPSTTIYKRGDVVLVPFPFTDLTSVKQRPALVISSDAANQTRPDVIVVAITSQIPAQLPIDEMAVPLAELNKWGLPKPSVIKLAKMFTIHQGLIRKSFGAAPAATLSQVLRQIVNQFAPDDEAAAAKKD